MKFVRRLLLCWGLLCAGVAHAQLVVTVSPVKVTGSKAVVKMELKNTFAENIESARVVVFLLDQQGRVHSQPTTRWVIGGSSTNHLSAVGTNSFHFVVALEKPFPSKNLTAKVAFNRVVLEGGKLADVTKNVQIEKVPK